MDVGSPDVRRPARRTLVIHPGALGDFIQALPALAALRADAGAERLALLTPASLERLAAESGLFDEIVTYDAVTVFHGTLRARLRLVGALARRLRGGAFTRAVIFKASPAYAALAAAAGIPTRIGFARSGERAGRAPVQRLASRLLTRPVWYTAGRHREDRNADLVAAAGADPARRATIGWGAADGAGVLVGALPTDAILVGIAPGGARNVKEEMPCRRWPVDRYVDLARQLARAEPRMHFVLLGGPGDAAETVAVRAALDPARTVDLTARTSLADARGVIARLHAFVGNDSALLHLAATTDTPLVAIFGPSDPREACPRRADVVALWNPARSVPCLDDVTGRLPPCVSPCCITRVDVDVVLAAVLDAVRDGVVRSRSPDAHVGASQCSRRA